jgi:hypothetical protein
MRIPAAVPGGDRLHRPAASTSSAALWLAELFVAQLGIGPQRMQRKILGSLRHVDFVSVDGSAQSLGFRNVRTKSRAVVRADNKHGPLAVLSV